ncbi:S1C family serine protease [Serinicoccus sp. LYQ131]|uniref:S1C family serine protease n=1 Tax=Serinicoccus sp. LYQ131 TaxID=3378797 RepID=UPI003853D4F9
MTDPLQEPPRTDRPPSRPRPVRRSMLPVLAVAVVAGLLGGLGGGVLALQLDAAGSGDPSATEGADSPESSASPAAADTAVPPVPTDGSISGLSSAVLPSVALILIGEDGDLGVGSGFVIRPDGYLLTNHHVIEAAGGAPISVEFPGAEPLTAQVVGSDEAYDIAVLRVDQAGLVALPFADSALVQVGQTVVAVGAPLGLNSTVTSGIVSALDRPVIAGDRESTSYISAIQTDAAINPGNSGGPLLDLSGQVVGVNSAIAQVPSGAGGGRPAGSIGLGFAIPAEQASRTADQLIQTGTSEHPVMGVLIDLTYTGDGARVQPGAGEDGGEAVVEGGPADRAGVRPGDVIVSVDGVRIAGSQELLVTLRSYAVGDTVEMVLRDEDGQERTVSITLAGSND